MKIEQHMVPYLIEIAGLLKVYRVYDHRGLVPMRRLGKDHDGGYVVPELALEKADAVLGYGIFDDISFEEECAERYGKRSYGFDGTKDFEPATHPLCQFLPISIISEAEREKLQRKPSKASSFKDHLGMLHLEDKKIFVKMDIEKAEYDTMPDVLKYASQITGITFEIHFECHVDLIPMAPQLLKQFEKDFVLVHVHGHNGTNMFSVPNARGNIPMLLELSYINKNLVDRFELSPNQSHPTELDRPTDHTRPEAAFEILV